MKMIIIIIIQKSKNIFVIAGLKNGCLALSSNPWVDF